MTRNVYTVTQVNRYVKKSLESDALLAGLFVEGEISNFNAHSSGHMYFTLKDATAAISAVMFRGNAADLPFVPRSGMKVIAFGRLSLFERDGKYQLYVEYLEPAGVGSLQIAFAQLKEKLEAEGFFDPHRKRAIPRFARCVAVITSPTGAAVQDIIRIIRERNRAIKIIIAPASVQGENAATDMCRAISEVNAHGEAEVIILGRGGGSVEDLWAFNEEPLARAIAASKIPIISAVGHETDFTIADFVADHRAPTPTAAAQIAAFDRLQVSEYIRGLRADICDALGEKIRDNFTEIRTLYSRLTRGVAFRLTNERQALAHKEELLHTLSPYAVFKRGFAITQVMGMGAVTDAGIDAKGKTITSVGQLSPGQDIEIIYADGSAIATIKDVVTKA